jgi:uncharacterized protein with HEPN domain
VIGEAANKINPVTQRTYSAIPWRKRSATRNRLIHGYFDVDYEIVWVIVKDDLPPLIV